MTKKEEIFKYLSENNEKDKEKLIQEVSQRFKVAAGTATTHYYEWKRKFMNNSNCIPKEQKKIENKEKPKEKQEIKVPHDINPINTSKLEVFKKPKITIIEGKVDYKGKEFLIKDGAVVVGEERFKNKDDLEEYRKKQIQEFYKQIGEISDVLDSIN